MSLKEGLTAATAQKIIDVLAQLDSIRYNVTARAMELAIQPLIAAELSSAREEGARKMRATLTREHQECVFELRDHIRTLQGKILRLEAGR